MITPRKQAGLIQSPRGWRGCCWRWGLRLRSEVAGEVTFGESEPPHALLQIRIQPCGGFKGFTEVQQRMGNEAKSTDSEPCE